MPMGLTPPPVPPWDGLHPLVVHFPIALVFMVPVMVAAAWAYPRGRHGLVICALATSLIATAFLWLASETGEAAFDHAVAVDGAQDILVLHEHLAERARNYFTVLTALLVIVVAVAWWRVPNPSRQLRAGAVVAYLVASLLGIALLSNAAHQGGRLVHEVGVRSVMAASSKPAGSPGSAD